MVSSDAFVGLAPGATPHRGDVEGEVRAFAAGERMVVPVGSQGGLRLTGADRVDFLNGQVSHDVRSLPEEGARLALLLDHRGRPQADLTIVKRSGDLFVSVDDARAERVRASLQAHIVFDQVELQDLSTTLALLVVAGHDVADMVDDALGAPGGTAGRALAAGPGGPVVHVPYEGASVLLHARRRAGVPSLDLHVLAAARAPIEEALVAAGARMAGEAVLLSARVGVGGAAAAAEGAEALPQEAGLDARVSYRKGCYLGQEIMARIEARGTLRRGLARLVLASAPADTAAREVHGSDGRAVGRVGSAAWTPEGWQALAVVRLDLAEGAALTALGVEASLRERLPAPS
jgi:tRNA-modifying protein YgfZ